MLNDRRITSNCEHCGHVNEFSLSHFAGGEDVFANNVVATCQSCKKDFIVDLYQADVH